MKSSLDENKEGKVVHLNRDNISIEDINSGAYLFEALNLAGFDKEGPIFKEATALISRDNFGYGSSPEQAVRALKDHGFRVIIAVNFAPIFRQNMFNQGLIAVELSGKQVDEICAHGWENYRLNLANTTLKFWTGKNETTGKIYQLRLTNCVLQGGLGSSIER